MRQPDEMRQRAEAASSIALDAGYYVHSLAGPGALEHADQAFLAEEIRFRGLPVRTQVSITGSHRGVTLDVAYRIALLVDEALVVEVPGTPS
jgi:GxxExxY protein